MKLFLVKFLLALISLAVVVSGILLFTNTVLPEAKEIKSIIQSSPSKTAKCDMSDFDGFPKTIEGPVTLEFKTLITVMVKNNDESASAEITLLKSRCEVK